MNASSLGMLPQNCEQAANLHCGETSGASMCSNKSVHDPLFMVMDQRKICESGNKFVHGVTASPEPMCILATEQQLTDLVRFSTVIVSVSCLLIQPFLWEILMSQVLLIKTCLCPTLEVVSVLFW